MLEHHTIMMRFDWGALELMVSISDVWFNWMES